MGKRSHEPVSPNALSLICQISAIGKHAANPDTNLNAAELAALMLALARSWQDINARLNQSALDSGRVA